MGNGRGLPDRNDQTRKGHMRRNVTFAFAYFWGSYIYMHVHLTFALASECCFCICKLVNISVQMIPIDASLSKTPRLLSIRYLNPQQRTHAVARCPIYIA